MLQEPSVIVETEYNHIKDASDSAVSLNSTYNNWYAFFIVVRSFW